MPSKHDRAQIDRSGGDRARCPRSVPRVSPRLEILETRCLMSDISGLEASFRTAPNPDTALVRSQHAAIEYSLPTLRRPLEEAEHRPTTAGSAGTALALQDPAHAAYVIVPETAAPHSTLASAQKLPNLPYFGVIGTLGSGNPIDFYQMPIGAAAGIQLELVAQQPAASTPVQLSLYDASGRVLGTWTSGARPQPDGSALRLDLPSQSPGSTLYVGISAPSSSGDGPAGPAPTTDYQLWVARSTAPVLPLSTGTGAGSAAVPNASSTLILGPFQPSTTPPPGQQAQASAPISTTSTAGTGPGLALAAGSLPTRAASPLGGVLASGTTTQPPVQQLSVTVNLEGSVRSSPPSDLDPRDAPGPSAEPGQAEGPQEVVAIRGPGGFPLLGAAAIGNWRRTPRGGVTGVVASAAKPAVSDQVDTLSPDRLALEDVPSAAAEPPASCAADSAPSRQVGWGESRVRLSFGLSMATVLTLNVILSDPVAGFDYLASRFDSARTCRSKFSRTRRGHGGPG